MTTVSASSNGKLYGYVAPQLVFPNANDGPTYDQLADGVKTALTASKTPVEYIFLDEATTVPVADRAGFRLLTKALSKGDVVYVWSWKCFVSALSPWMLSQVQTVLATVNDQGASIYFVDEQLSTASAKDRYSLATLISHEQYQFDLHEGKTASAQTACTSCSSGSSSSSN